MAPKRDLPAATSAFRRSGSASSPATASATWRGASVEQHPGVTEHLAHRPGVEGDDREAVAHGLHQRDAEPLVVGEHHQHVGVPVVGGQLGVADAGDELDRVGQPQRAA